MAKKRKIIAVVGMAGAGKSSACQFLGKKDFVILRFGDQTDIGLRQLNLPLTEKNERKYRENLRKKLGMAAYAIKIEPRIKKALEKNNKIVLDGLYSWEEYIYLKNKYKDLMLLCIYSSPKLRYQRLKQRKQRGLSVKEARKRDIAELTNLNKGGPIAIADYLIINNDLLKNLYKKLNIFLKLLK